MGAGSVERALHPGRVLAHRGWIARRGFAQPDEGQRPCQPLVAVEECVPERQIVGGEHLIDEPPVADAYQPDEITDRIADGRVGEIDDAEQPPDV